jgi:hypothetical protein
MLIGAFLEYKFDNYAGQLSQVEVIFLIDYNNAILIKITRNQPHQSIIFKTNPIMVYCMTMSLF